MYKTVNFGQIDVSSTEQILEINLGMSMVNCYHT